MDISIFFIFISIVITFVIASFYFSKKARIKRKLKNTPLKDIANFKDHEVAKVIGNVKIINKPFIAPLSKRECAHYYIKVERKVSNGKSSHWKTIIEEEIGHHFLIKDGDHYAFLNDQNIKSYIVQDEKFSSGFGNDATKNLEKYLNSKGEESEGFLGFNKTIRYFEGILEDNEKIAITGKGIWKDTSQFNLNIEAKRVLEITSEINTPVYLSDDPDTTIKKTNEISKVNSSTSNFNNRRRNRN